MLCIGLRSSLDWTPPRPGGLRRQAAGQQAHSSSSTAPAQGLIRLKVMWGRARASVMT